MKGLTHIYNRAQAECTLEWNPNNRALQLSVCPYFRQIDLKEMAGNLEVELINRMMDGGQAHFVKKRKKKASQNLHKNHILMELKITVVGFVCLQLILCSKLPCRLSSTYSQTWEKQT